MQRPDKIEAPERGIMYVDTVGCVQSANKRAADIFEIPIARLVGSPAPRVLGEPEPRSTLIVDEVLEHSLRPEAVLHRYSAPLLDSQGNAGGRVEILSDITVRRELEAEILERNRQLAELNVQLQEAQEQLLQSERLRALGEMAAGVAHDINNVLGIILGNAQLARRKMTEDTPAYECVRGIELAARDAAETVRRLREIGKPVDTSTYAPVDLSDVAREVVSAAFPAWQESGSVGDTRIDVSTDLEDGCVVLGNATELREALANLFLNAAQSIDREGRISITTRKRAGAAELAISDTGSGMNEETRKRLFDPFFTTRGSEGTGLGMSMVDAITIRHHGKVLVESEEGKGAIVTLRIPLIRTTHERS